MNEFVQREIIKERTGANVSPISVDTQSRYLTNSGGIPSINVGHSRRIPIIDNRSEFLEGLAKIVKETEQQKIKNNKLELEVQFKKMDLDFQEKWQKDKEKFTTNYEAYLKEFEEVNTKKKEIVKNNRFLDNEEKNRYYDKLDIDRQEDRLRLQETKDKIFIQTETEKSIALIEQAVDLAGTYGVKNDKKVKELYKHIADTRYNQKNISGMTDDKYLVLLGRDLANAETNRLSTEIQRIINSDIPLSAKDKELKNIYAVFENNASSDLLATEIVEEFYKGENKEQAKEYLALKLQGNFKSLIKQTKSAINQMQRQEKAMLNFNKQQKQREEYEDMRRIEDALNRKDAITLAVLRNKENKNKKLSMREFLDNPKYMASVTDLNWDTFGNVNAGETLRFLTPSTIQGIDKARENIRINGGTFAEEMVAVYEVADAIANGNQAIRNNVLKNYGLEKRINPAILIKGENNKEYFKHYSGIQNATTILNQNEIDYTKLKKIRDEKVFKSISKDFSPNEAVGDELAMKYILSEMMKKYKLDQIKNDILPYKNTLKRINEYKNDNKNLYDNDLKLIKEISTSKVNYKFTSLKDNTQNNKVKKKTYESKYFTDDE